MNIRATILELKRLQHEVDWKLLLFLLLFLDVKLAIKIPAIVFIYLFQFNFKFGFKLKDSRLPLFYPLIIAIAIVGGIINGSYKLNNYLVVLPVGIGFWLLCILAVHQVKLSVENNEVRIIHQTILVFFVVNAVFSLLNIVLIIKEIGTINPYTYQGQYQKYFIGTGDYIRGISFDTSTTNAIINGFGVIYFLVRKDPVMLFLCMAVLLLTGSNFINLALLFILVLLFIFKSTRDQKSLILICLMFLVVFMTKISPQNNTYVVETFRNALNYKKIPTAEQPRPLLRITERPDSSLNAEEKREKIATSYIDSVHRKNDQLNVLKEVHLLDRSVEVSSAGRINVPKADINSAPYQSLVTTPPGQRQLVTFIQTHKKLLPISGKPYHWSHLPGKITGMQQTLNFFKQHPSRIMMGDGLGNFSSKLAFRASGLGFTGGYPIKYTYINPDFLKNHLDLYLNFFSKRAGLHSLTNSPFSVYDQLLAEYGIIGVLAFCIYYAGFFLKHRKALTYGLPILVLTLAVLFTDYWFEQLSVLILFELFLFLDIKESSVSTI